MRKTLLIVDDDVAFATGARDFLAGDDLQVTHAGDLASARATLAAHAPDVVLLDERLPDGEGHSLCEAVREANPRAKIVFVTAYPSFDHALVALRAGAHEYLCKPIDPAHLRLTLERCLRVVELERLETLVTHRAQQESAQSPIIGTGAATALLRDLVARAGPAEAPVLITGETGTGKSMVARAIHAAGPRRDRPFVALSCAALPEGLIEAELFGWERGAFTGAVAQREGYLEMASGGTLFLDEIGDLPLRLQPKLLTALEDHEVKRVGGRHARAVDVRIIAATNAELARMVEEKTFRADLYYRLDVFHIHVPPLRDRREDLPALCAHLLKQLRGNQHLPALADDEVRRLQAYPWPGNVRELRNVLERSLLLQQGPLAPSALLAPARPAPALAPPAPADEGTPTLAAVERAHIHRVLTSCGGNQSQAARLLGMSLSTLKRRLKDLPDENTGPA